MQLVSLDSNYKPKDLIEEATTVIWTERFFADHEVEIKAYDIENARRTLAPDTLVSHLETDEVIQIETFVVDTDSDDREVATIKGRSYAQILMENRIVTGGRAGMDKSWKLTTPRTVGDTALFLFRYHLITGGGSTFPEDALPGATTTKSFTPLDPPHPQAVPKSDLYQAVLPYLVKGVIGIRARRPASGSSGIDFQFYDGTDRSETVIFSHLRDDLVSPQYLNTSADIKNTAMVISPDGNVIVTVPQTPAPSGNKRKMILVDATDVTKADYPDPQWNTMMVLRGAQELQKFSLDNKFVYDGEISPQSQYSYGSNYFLGDKVRLIGKYGEDEVMMVGEHVIAWEDGATRRYPTLVPPLSPWIPRPMKKYNPGGGVNKGWR